MNGIQEVRGSIPLSSTIKSRRNLRLLSFSGQNSPIGRFSFFDYFLTEIALWKLFFETKRRIKKSFLVISEILKNFLPDFVFAYGTRVILEMKKPFLENMPIRF